MGAQAGWRIGRDIIGIAAGAAVDILWLVFLSSTDIYEIVRIQARLQQLEAMLRIPKAFAEDLECEALHKNHKEGK